MTTLEEQYLARCATPSDVYLHLPRFVDLVEHLDAQYVIELGTRSGVSTIAWLYGLSKTGGKLTSVDIDERPDIGEWPGWEFIQGDDLDAKVFAQLEPAEIVFIDTSHHYRQTLSELNLYRWLVKPGGVMVLHDTELAVPEGAPPTDPRYPVKTAMVEFCATNGFDYTLIQECWGLGLIKIP